VSNDVVIKVSNLSKKYLLRHEQRERYTALRDVITRKAKSIGQRVMSPFRSPLSAPSSSQEEFYALRAVNFEIKRGDRVGIIGRNGAGKSTLLKVLSRITEPTSGRIEITGRVASLLEVGTGFHPELTGRENIFLNGAILGMTKAEIKRKFDEIVAFAEVEKFLDTPVKRYSSGMYVRLAFAVAAHLEPEILIVDEVLSVGDAQFQKKCLGKMEEVGKEGRTILFVSHNMAQINKLCSDCILLALGQVDKRGHPSSIIQDYLSQTDSTPLRSLNGEALVVDQDIDLLEFFSCDEAGNSQRSFKSSEPINVRIKYLLKRNVSGLRVGFDLVGFSDGEILFRTFDDDIKSKTREQGVAEAICSIPKDLLKPGIYSIRLQVGIHNIRWIINGTISEKVSVQLVDGVNSSYGDYRPGKIMPQVEWN
jgi:lipopolysaccharide transport system ATP-binding protein